MLLIIKTMGRKFQDGGFERRTFEQKDEIGSSERDLLGVVTVSPRCVLSGINTV